MATAYSSTSRRSGQVLQTPHSCSYGRFHYLPSRFPSASYSTYTSNITPRSSTPDHTYHRGSSLCRPDLYDLVRSASPARINIGSITAFGSQSGSQVIRRPVGIPKRTCMCAPTDHPGSFRCSFHKSAGGRGGNTSSNRNNQRLHLRKIALVHSLVRIGGVEGDYIRRTLVTVRPSSHHIRRRSEFRHVPSRLSVMSKTDD